jgi:signal transduction histidine kinase
LIDLRSKAAGIFISLRKPWMPALFLTAVVLGAIWLTLAAYIESTRVSIENEAEQELGNALTVTRTHAMQVYRNAQMMLNLTDDWVASQPPNQSLTAFENLSGLVRHVQMGTSDRALPILLFSASGYRVWREPRATVSGTTYVGDRDYIIALQDRQPGTFFVGTPIVSRSDGSKSLPISLRLHDNNLAVRYASTNVTERNFGSIFANLTDIAPSTAGLIRTDGTMLFLWPINDKLKGQIIPGFSDVLARGALPARNNDVLPGPGGIGSLRVAFTKVADLPLIVFVGLRVDDLEAVLWSEVMVPTLLAALATAVIGPMGFWVTLLMRRRAVESEQLSTALVKAEAANETKMHFLANMSHELRTPLNAVIGFSEVLEKELLGPLGAESYRIYAKDIGDSGRHLLGIISQILETAKLESGSLANPEVISDLADQLPACLRLLSDTAASRQVQLAPCLLPDLPPVRIDPLHLRQVLINLIGNAIKFSHPGGTVEIAALAKPGGMLRIEVRDQGVGIKPENMAELFKPFSQVEKSLSRQHGGVGLGLVNTRRLIEAYNGRVYLESVYSRGTTAVVEIPVAQVGA